MTIKANWNLLRPALLERAGGRCEVTGEPLGDSWACHHRRKRGMGGTTLADTHSLPNLMAVTHRIHNLGTPSIHLRPAWAIEQGYLLPWWCDPLDEPILLHGRRRVWLTADGHYASQPPPK